MWDEGMVRAEARDNHGLIDRPTALSLGASDHLIGAALRQRRWEEVHPGVYYLNVTPRTWMSEVAAAVLGAGSHAVASHRTAGRIWGLDGISGSTVEVTVPFTSEPLPFGVIVHRTRRRLLAENRQRVPLTTVERTLLDLARLVPDRVLERATESALRRHLTTVPRIATTVRTEGGRGVTGTRRLRRVLQRVDGDISGSFAEVDVKALIRDAPIPHPVLQLRVHLPNGHLAYPDFAWPHLMKIVEADGFEAHSTPEQLEHDLRRQNMLMELGWQIRRFTAREIRLRPQEVIAEIVRFVNA